VPGLSRGLTTQFFLFFILPLTAALVVVALGSQWLHQSAMRTLVADRDQRAVEAVAAALDARLNDRGRLVTEIAAALVIEESSAASALGILAANFDGGLAVFDSEGAWQSGPSGPALWVGRPTMAWLAALSPGSPASFSPGFDEPDGRTLVLVGAKATDGRTVVGAFSPAALIATGLGGAGAADAGPSLVLIDMRGEILAQYGTPLLATPVVEHPGVRQALAGASGTERLVGQGAHEHLVAYAAVPAAGWALLSEEPLDVVESPLLRNTLWAPLVLIPVIVLALIVLGFGLREIVAPLRALERQARELGQGHYGAVDQPVGGIAEVQRLQAELRRMAQKVRLAQSSLRGYLGAMTAGQEEERRRLARELHDDTVQALIALDQRAQLALHAAREATPAARERLTEVRGMTSDLIDHVRRVIRAMRPIYLEDLGLLPALEMLARDVETDTNLKVSFNVTGAPRRLGTAEEIGLYRIAQESLNNARRHAAAQRITVEVIFEPERLLMRIVDDGRGFDVAVRIRERASEGHYGLMGLQERAELIGAQLDLVAAPGKGTAVVVRLALPARTPGQGDERHHDVPLRD